MRKFRADSESDIRIRLSFELTILGLCKTHVHAHLPNYVEFLYIKLKKQQKYYFEKTKMFIKKIKTLFCQEFNDLCYFMF